MADKLNDKEIVNELKRFGETVKVPFDKRKRQILIKKLNHYYVRENPPPKKGKAAVKPPKRSSVQVEFSGDSQDESESADVVDKIVRNKSPTVRSPVSRSPARRSLRGKLANDGANSSLNTSKTRNAKTKKSHAHQVEIYPDEFSDADTADESIYVEQNSIGINTSLAYDDDDDDDDEEESYVVESPRNRPNRKYTPTNISTISQQNTSMNNIGAKGRQSRYSREERSQFISKIILTVVAIFFVILAISYIYIRRDIFLSQEAALTPSDLSQYQFEEDGKTLNFSQSDTSIALSILNKIYAETADRKGKYLKGEKHDCKMELAEVKKLVTERTPQNVDDMMALCLHLILEHPEYSLIAWTASDEKATTTNEVSAVENEHASLSMVERVYLAVVRVMYILATLIVGLLVGLLGIYCVRWQNKRKEVEQEKVYDMVEKIIDMLKENFELSERKNDPKNYPPYVAVQHIRDQLIPIKERRDMKSLWDEAVKFIETNESRIRVETQAIQGEEFTVWRWLQAMPNGHKMWQGQAFGETSQCVINSLPYGPTPCLKVRNMFNANMEKNLDDWHKDIEEGILEKCKDNHGIYHIFVDRSSKEGCVYIKCSSCEKAYETYQALHGWWFDGRLVTVKYLRLETYHERFPDSQNCRRPLQPSKTDMRSVSMPYHRSALEMT